MLINGSIRIGEYRVENQVLVSLFIYSNAILSTLRDFQLARARVSSFSWRVRREATKQKGQSSIATSSFPFVSSPTRFHDSRRDEAKIIRRVKNCKLKPERNKSSEKRTCEAHLVSSSDLLSISITRGRYDFIGVRARARAHERSEKNQSCLSRGQFLFFPSSSPPSLVQ